jgi:hypothetical protein
MFFFNSTSHTINYNYKHPRHIQLPTYASSRNTQWHRKRNSVRLSLCFISSHVSSFALFLHLSVCWFVRFLSLHLPVCPLVCQSVYLTIRLFPSLSVCLFCLHLSICPSVLFLRFCNLIRRVLTTGSMQKVNEPKWVFRNQNRNWNRKTQKSTKNQFL